MAAGQGLKEDHVAIARDGLTTIYEIMFPSSEFGIAKFEDGMSLGLGICVNDGDGPDQLGQRGWGGWYTHAAVFGKTQRIRDWLRWFQLKPPSIWKRS